MKISTKFYAFAMAAVLILPVAAFASDSNTKIAEKNSNSKSDFCANISTITSKLSKQLSDASVKVESEKSDNAKEVQDKWTERDDKLNSERENGDLERVANLKKLEQRAQTDAQKQAVKDFETAINTAITNRRAAVDQARKTYKDGFTKIFNDRQAAVDKTKGDFQAAINQAIQKATSDCSAGITDKVARQNLNDAIKAAKKDFSNNRKDIDKAGLQVKALVQVRNTAIKEAMTDFKATVQKAAKDLKAAFPTA